MPQDAMPENAPFADLAAYAALPRLTDLALSGDGGRLVAVLQQPDAASSRYVSSLWEIPLAGGDPTRLTFSDAGESAPVFTPGGDLLFVSSRARPKGGADGAGGDTESALWSLGRGEAELLAVRPGGVGAPVVAASAGTVLVQGSRLRHTPTAPDTSDDVQPDARTDAPTDAQRRATRKDRRISAILHDGMPIRYWDHELGDVSPRLLQVGDRPGDQRDLVPDATTELSGGDYSVSADGTTVAVQWKRRERRGVTLETFAVLDVATGHRELAEPESGYEYSHPVLSPDGSTVAVGRQRIGTFDTAVAFELALIDVGADSLGPARVVPLGDMVATEWVWTADSATLVAGGDLHGRGALVRIDPAAAAVASFVARDAVYTALRPAPAGDRLYALRSTMDSAPTPVVIEFDADGGAADVRALPTPAPTPPLPGRLVELDVPVNGTTVHAWLFLPPEGAAPAPVMQWIHGGPFMSYQSWSWRWNPWVAVAHGWAVVLPDPALSTGYGQQCIDRAWPYRADVVWDEVEQVLDAVLARPDVDASRTALLGGSFGGFMTNWIAGHTERFGAIVTHAGLWALDQQHATTDAADYKTGIFGRPADHEQWYETYSPHHSVAHIVTPMLVVHGNRDYRVPVSEALRLWWDLVSHFPGEPGDLPHRFLQFTGENHWVLSPANSEIWYDAVLGFCGQHVLGREWTPSPLL